MINLNQVKKVGLLITVCLIVTGTLLFMKFKGVGEEKVTLEMDAANQDLQMDMENKDVLLKAITEVPQEEHTGEIIFKDKDAKRGTIKDSIERLFASISLNNMASFMQTFDPQVLNDSLLAFENEDNQELISGFMNDINKSGIKKVQVQDLSSPFGDSLERKVTVSYEDQRISHFTISFRQSVSEFHDEEHNKGKYLITTSPLEIIKNIENNIE